MMLQNVTLTNVQLIDSSTFRLQKHINETVNIIPPYCNVSMKLTDSEAKKYLEQMRKNDAKVMCVTPGYENTERKSSPAEVRLVYIENKNRLIVSIE